MQIKGWDSDHVSAALDCKTRKGHRVEVYADTSTWCYMLSWKLGLASSSAKSENEMVTEGKERDKGRREWEACGPNEGSKPEK